MQSECALRRSILTLAPIPVAFFLTKRRRLTMKECFPGPPVRSVPFTLRTQFISCGLLLSLPSSILAQSKSAQTATTKPDFSSVQKLIQEQLVAQSVPSLSLAVARRGEIVWEQGFGWADKENRIPATEHTMYALASVTKTITATALM